MLRTIVEKTVFVAFFVILFPHCTRSNLNTSSTVQGQSGSIHPKMETLRALIREKFQSPTKVEKTNANWKVVLESTKQDCSRGRLRLSIQGIKEPNRGAEIYINFINERKDFDIMVDWADDRETLLFYAHSDEAEMDKKINESPFIDLVQLITAAANMTEHEGLGMVAYYLLTWYPEGKHSELFKNGLKLSYVSDGSVVENYKGKTKEGESCEVTVSKDQHESIFSVETDIFGTARQRFLWFNIIPGRQTFYDACTFSNFYTNTNAVVDGKRKVQWTFAKSEKGVPMVFRTSFQTNRDADGKETLTINRANAGYSSHLFIGTTMPIDKTQIKLCMDRGRVEKASIVRKTKGFTNISLLVPVPFLGASFAIKFTTECDGLNLQWSRPIMIRTQ